MRRIDYRCARFRDRGCMGRAIASPKVEIETKSQRGLAVVLPATRKELCGNAIVAALAADTGFRLGSDSRESGRTDALDLSLGAPDPGPGSCNLG